VAIGTLGAVVGGPAMGDHEALVAQCARDMRVNGEWLVPHYLGEPYVRKPPLPYWLIAGLSYVLPADSHTGLPVSTTVARLPSALAAFGTVLLLWKLAAFMFSPRVGRVAAVIGGSSLFFMLYAANATVEMLLTFCCVWAHLHFWFGIHHPVGSMRRRVHLFFFYVAMGLGMMAKGPFPLVMVALPIMVWWYLDKPLSFVAMSGQQAWGILVQGGTGAWRSALRAYAQGWVFALAEFLMSSCARLRVGGITLYLPGLGPRTVQAFRELWVIPGLVVFALCFVPWMIAVGIQHPHAWELWNWQYFQRAQGKYEDTRPRGIFYYVPRLAGLTLPWLFLIFEGIASPWMRKYAAYRRPLLYVGLWALFGAVIMSLIEFKKPYYVVPMMPALVLMMALVADRFYTTPLRQIRLAWGIWGAFIIAGTGGAIGSYFWIQRDYPQAAGILTAICAGALVLLAIAGLAFIRGMAWTGFGTTAATAVFAFMASWYCCGDLLENVGKVTALNQVLEDQEIPHDAKVYWATRRQDSRLSFYHARYTEQMVQPAEALDVGVDRTEKQADLEEMVLDRAQSLLNSPEPVYLILDRDEYAMARLLGVGRQAHVIGFAPDASKKENDWMVISNVHGKQ
jgi:4-amino-4-deoxy-L-arabinose transferase-like glycosyltransferase